MTLFPENYRPKQDTWSITGFCCGVSTDFHLIPHYWKKRRKQYDALHLLISATAAVYEHLFLSGLHGHKSPETGFLHEVSGISLRHEVGNLAFGRMLEVELLFLTFWYGQLRRFRHLIGMPGGWNSQCTSSWEEPWRPTHNWLDGLLDYPTWNTSGTFVVAWMCWSGWWRPEYPTQPVGTAAWSWVARRWCMDGWAVGRIYGNMEIRLSYRSIRMTKSGPYTFFFVILTAFDSSVYLWRPVMHWFEETGSLGSISKSHTLARAT